MKRVAYLALVGVSAFALACATGSDSDSTVGGIDGADDAIAVSAPEIDAAALAVVRRMATALQGAERLSFRAETSTDAVLSSGQSIEVGRESEVTLRRPDGLHLDLWGPKGRMAARFDGETFALEHRDRGLYATHVETMDIDALLDRLADRFGIVFPLSDLIVSDPYDAVSEYADEGIHLGVHRVRGIPCDHVAFANDRLEWQIWTETGDRPVPHKFVIVYKDEPGAPRFTAFLSNWNLASSVPDSAFTFTPREGTSEIEMVSSADVYGDDVGAEGETR